MADDSYIKTKLDSTQVIRRVYDEDENRLRVDAEVTATIGKVVVDISAADGDNIAISDGINTAVVNPDGSLDVNIVNPIQIEVSAADGDNVAVSDGVNTLAINPDGSINTDQIQLLNKDYDAGTQAYPSGTQEVIVTYSGGLSGTPVQRVTLNYADPNKENLLNFQRETWNGSSWVIG